VALTVGAVLAAAGVASRPLAFAMFVCGAFVVASVGQEFWRGVAVRRTMTGQGPLRALGSLVGRNRRRYGGYLVHVGMAVLFIGVAASTAFNAARDMRLGVGQTARVGGYEFRYVKPTSRISTTPAGNLEKISFGAVVDVRRDGRHVTTLRPERGYFPSPEGGGLGPVGRFFEGTATSEIGLRAGLRRDVWTAMTPDIRALLPVIQRGDAVFAAAGGKLPQAVEAAALGTALRGLVDRYVANPPPATFRLLVSPLVGWIWVGGIVVFLGGLTALWPAPGGAPRRARAEDLARVSRDLGRA
jgi:cytochrome c-type biogenesis protein CcmF